MLGAIKSIVTGVEKPVHELTKKEAQYEIRSYPAAKWASSTVKSISHKEAVSKSFWKLFKYIQGENEGKVNIEMTAPVTTYVKPGEGPNCESTFTTSFYVPAIHQEKTPTPTNPEVFIEERPAMTFYVGSFGGFADDEKWIDAGKKLTEAIGDESKFEANFYYTAGYDAPFKLIGRTNEVWFLKKDA